MPILLMHINFMPRYRSSPPCNRDTASVTRLSAQVDGPPRARKGQQYAVGRGFRETVLFLGYLKHSGRKPCELRDCKSRNKDKEREIEGTMCKAQSQRSEALAMNFNPQINTYPQWIISGGVATMATPKRQTPRSITDPTPESSGRLGFVRSPSCLRSLLVELYPSTRFAGLPSHQSPHHPLFSRDGRCCLDECGCASPGRTRHMTSPDIPPSIFRAH